MGVERNDFIASKETMRDLRRDYSVVRDSFQESLGTLVREVSDFLVTKYGEFMPNTKDQISDGIENRLLFLTKESYVKFHKDWLGREESRNPTAYVCKKGGITVLLDTLEVWAGISQTEKEKFIEYFGSKEQAITELTYINLIANIVHETVHQFQDWSLPELFFEMGTVYYQEEINRERDYECPTTEKQDKISHLYKELIEEFGEENMHKLYFGGFKNTFERKMLLMQVEIFIDMKDAKSLLPGYGNDVGEARTN